MNPPLDFDDCLDYPTKLHDDPNNPIYACVFSSPNTTYYEQHQTHSPFWLYILPHLEVSDIPLDHILPQHIPIMFLPKSTTGPLVCHSLEARNVYLPIRLLILMFQSSIYSS